MKKTIKAIEWFYHINEKEAKETYAKQTPKSVEYIVRTYTNRPKHCPRYA